MATPLIPPRARRQAGFTMVEMVLAAFVLAVGLLGLTMLQTMAIRTTSSGGRMAKAVKIADGILDTIANEGRVRRLISQYQDNLSKLNTTVYFAGGFTQRNIYFDKSDNVISATTGTPGTQPAGTVFAAYVRPITPPGQPTDIQGMSVKAFEVTVEFLEVSNANAAASTFKRTAKVTRVVGNANS